MTKTFDDAMTDLQFALQALGLNKSDGVLHATVYTHVTSSVCIDAYLLVSVVKRGMDLGFKFTRNRSYAGDYVNLRVTGKLATFEVDLLSVNTPNDVLGVVNRLLDCGMESLFSVPVAPPGAGKVAAMNAAVAAVEADGGTAVVLQRQSDGGDALALESADLSHTVVKERGDVVLPAAPAVVDNDYPF